MINVRCPLGEFKIEDTFFTEGNAKLKALYDVVMVQPLYVWEGTQDLAIATRMMDLLDQGWKILDHVYPEVKNNQPN